MKKQLLMAAAITVGLAAGPLFAADDDGGAAKRLDKAATVFSEIMTTPDKGIPTDLIEKAHCAVIVPNLKSAGFIVGGKYGRGFMTCRKASGAGWSAPGAVRIEGGSVGFQIGASDTDLVMLVMSEKGANGLLSSKFTMGGEMAVAAGPVGRSTSAQTDANLKADILSWSRTEGLFAGVALEGATLRDDVDENAELYGGKKLENSAIVKNAVAPPAAAGRLLSILNKYSHREEK